ncbi:MAG: gamma-glutamyl-gamma-aminobutyrate hydrolase family protein [Chloroflexi bacterium]|nr:gamma-glutamyl-gamma-aminobutyrate hydrolase family protein [Chloroflexota bacterium]
MTLRTKPLIAISTSTLTGDDPEHCSAAVERAGGEPWLIVPGNGLSPDEILSKANGLLVTGGEDIDPSWYGQEIDPNAHVYTLPERDAFEQPLLRAAIEADYPILCICRGFQALNVAMGGTLVQHLDGHRTEASEDREQGFTFHRIYITPGSKLTSILGIGGFVRVNSWHHQGIREANRSPRLLTSAYSLDDGLVEGLESTEHDWVIGLQCHPETPGGVPPYFENLFKGFVERAARRLEVNSIG